MNENLPYEDELNQQLNDLPMPDMSESWQKMEVLLDKDERDRRFVFAFNLRTCAGAILLLIALAGIWFWFSNRNKGLDVADNSSNSVAKETKEIPGSNQQSESRPSQQSAEASTETSRRTGDLASEKVTNTGEDVTNNGTQQTRKAIITGKNEPTGEVAISTRLTNQASRKTQHQQSRAIVSQGATASVRKTSVNGRKSGAAEVKVYRTTTARINSAQRKNTRTNELTKDNNAPPAGVAPAPEEKPAPSTSAAPSIPQTPPQEKKVDSLPLRADPPAVDSTIKKIVKSKGNPFWFSAGLGLQQGIPVAGQSTVPYNYYGRTSSLFDYIPSVWFRVNRKDKWYLMAEFRYGAPQSVKEFSFNRKTVYDTATNNLTVTSTNLKKTYYHQIPVSFNYYVMPRLSLGAGVIYSAFVGAVTERETYSKNVITNVESFKTQIQNVKGYTDSFLYSSQVHLLLQTEYQWKRFVFALRYTKDLQPYIKFTRPDGTVETDKNQSLQFILRYSLWESKRK